MKSIRRQLLWSLLLGLLIVAAISAACLYAYVRTVLTRQFDMGVSAKARAIASLLEEEEGGRFELEFADEQMPEFAAAKAAAYFEIWLRDGTVLERSESLRRFGEPPRCDLPHPALDKENLVSYDLVLPDGRRGRAAALRIDASGGDAEEADEVDEASVDAAARRLPSADGGVRLVVAQGREELDRVLSTLRWSLWIAGIVMSVGAGYLVMATVHRGLAPLNRLAQEAGQITADSLGTRFAVLDLPRELQPVGARLNDLLQRLEEAFHRERRFTADVAHELRTPIAELRSLADVALKWTSDAENSQRYFQDARDIAVQMEAIVSTLLSVARAQAGQLQVACDPVQLATLVGEAWQPFQGCAKERNLSVNLDVPGDLTVESDRALLKSMLSNLFSNAVEYTPPGGDISCQAESADDSIQLTVRNLSDSLKAGDLPHLFEPFWRKDAARGDRLHAGLGLSVVSTFAEALGIQLDAEFEPPGHLTVRLKFPHLAAPVA